MADTYLAPLPAVGASFQLTRGLLPMLYLVTAADGGNAERVYIDPDDDDISVSDDDNGTYTLSGTVTTEAHGSFSPTVTLTASGDAASGYTVSVSATGIPSTSALTAIGFALEASKDANHTHYLLSPVFSGMIFEDPHDLIADAHDLNYSCSMQCMAYWSSDGTGLAIHGTDATGYKPKYFRFEPINSDADLRITVGTWLPGDNVGGQDGSTLCSWKVLPYHFNPSREDGWEHAAKLYRNWLIANATGSGNILEQGAVADRSDTPTWLKQLELMVTDIASWYPDSATVADPFTNLTTHQTELECTNILLALWSWTRDANEGKVGTWYPSTELAGEIATLLGNSIRTSGYTWPHAFDQANDAYSSVSGYTAEDRDGNVQTETGSGNTYSVMDVAQTGLATYYQNLASYHATNFSVRGFYTDLPTASGTQDYDRGEGYENGRSYQGYAGMAAIQQAMIAGGPEGSDWAIFHEACFEWLIRSSNLGQGTTLTYARVVPGDSRSYGVPFFQRVYSGYTMFWPADPALGTQTTAVVPTAYGAFTEFNISRLQAEGVCLGGVPNTSEVYMPGGEMFYEHTVGDSAIDAWLQHHKVVLKSAIALRAAAREYIAHGQMLADPRDSGDEASMTLNVYYLSLGDTEAETYTKPTIHTRAFKADDGTVRVVAFNGSNASASTSIDPSRIGMRKAKRLVDVTDATAYPVVADADSRSRVAEVTVGAGEYRILEVV